MTDKIPLIDLDAFVDEHSSQSRLQSAQKLVQSLHQSGFVYIKNHGLPAHELQEIFALCKKFFDLPDEEKLKAPHPNSWQVHRGYSHPGLEKVSNALSTGVDEDQINELRAVQDIKETFDIGSEFNTEQPNIWPPPDVLPGFQESMTRFYLSCFEVAKRILRAIAIGLGVDDIDLLLRPHSGVNNQLRLAYYPPAPVAKFESGNFARMPAHSDWSTITLLFQDDCGGLQVEDKPGSGNFVDVLPVEDTLVLNVGDMLMRWSNDYLRSTQHRVNPPPLPDRYTGNQRWTRARFSIPYFVSPDPDVLIDCLNLGKNNPPKYDPISQRDYNALRAKMQY